MAKATCSRPRARAKRHGHHPKEDLTKSNNAIMDTLIAFIQLLSSRVQVFVNLSAWNSSLVQTNFCEGA